MALAGRKMLSHGATRDHGIAVGNANFCSNDRDDG